MKFYRDGLEQEIDSSPLCYQTRDGHVVEQYKIGSVDKYFVTLSGTHYCAHGNSIQDAITDALWKDKSKRPSLEDLKSQIQKDGKERKITLNEFRTLTGACLEGCRAALKKAGLDGSPMTAFEVKKYFPEWGSKLIEILEF